MADYVLQMLLGADWGCIWRFLSAKSSKKIHLVTWNLGSHTFHAAYLLFTVPFSTLPTSPSSPSLLVPMSLMSFTKGYSTASESPSPGAPLTSRDHRNRYIAALMHSTSVLEVCRELRPFASPPRSSLQRRTQIKAFPNRFRRWCSLEPRCRTKKLACRSNRTSGAK